MNKSLVSKLNVYVALLFFLVSAFSEICDAKLDMKTVVAMWLLDEGGGEQIADASGNGHDGRFVGGRVKWVDGKFGKGLEFTQEGWAEMNAPVVVDTVDWSMGCWVKPRGQPKTLGEHPL